MGIRHRTRCLAVAGVLSAIVAVQPIPVVASGCIRQTQPAAWEELDTAFVAVVLDAGDRQVVVRPTLVAKGAPPATVTIEAPPGDSLELGEVPSGTEVVVAGTQGHLSVVTHDWRCGAPLTQLMVRAFAGGLPVTDGEGPPAFAVAGWVGDANLTLLDRAGRPLNFAKGTLEIEDWALCTGGRFLATLGRGAHDDILGMAQVEIVDVLTGAVVAKSRVFDYRWRSGVACPDPEGRTVIVASERYGGPDVDGPVPITRIDGVGASAWDPVSSRLLTVGVDAPHTLTLQWFGEESRAELLPVSLGDSEAAYVAFDATGHRALVLHGPPSEYATIPDAALTMDMTQSPVAAGRHALPEWLRQPHAAMHLDANGRIVEAVSPTSGPRVTDLAFPGQPDSAITSGVLFMAGLAVAVNEDVVLQTGRARRDGGAVDLAGERNKLDEPSLKVTPLAGVGSRTALLGIPATAILAIPSPSVFAPEPTPSAVPPALGSLSTAAPPDPTPLPPPMEPSAPSSPNVAAGAVVAVALTGVGMGISLLVRRRKGPAGADPTPPTN